MKPEPAVFTKERPCSKIEIFLCFWGSRNFCARQVYEVEAELGRHVPRHMVSAGRLDLLAGTSQDLYELTDEGKQWLRDGIITYLNNHPERIKEAWDVLPLSIRSRIKHHGG